MYNQGSNQEQPPFRATPELGLRGCAAAVEESPKEI